MCTNQILRIVNRNTWEMNSSPLSRKQRNRDRYHVDQLRIKPAPDQPSVCDQLGKAAKDQIAHTLQKKRLFHSLASLASIVQMKEGNKIDTKGEKRCSLVLKQVLFLLDFTAQYNFCDSLFCGFFFCVSLIVVIVSLVSVHSLFPSSSSHLPTL